MAQIDGGIVSEPLVSGGHIYVLTHDAGLYVLGDGTTPSATPVATPGAVVDLRTPVVCTAAPSDSPMLGNLPATPTIPQVAPWKQPIPFTSIPSGVASDVDAVTAAQLETLFNAYRACSAVDPYHGVFGFFSTDFYVRLKSVQEYWGEPDQPWAVWMASMQEFLRLDTNSLQRLPDGRIGGTHQQPLDEHLRLVRPGKWRVEDRRISPNLAGPPLSCHLAGAFHQSGRYPANESWKRLAVWSRRRGRFHNSGGSGSASNLVGARATPKLCLRDDATECREGRRDFSG